MLVVIFIPYIPFRCALEWQILLQISHLKGQDSPSSPGVACKRLHNQQYENVNTTFLHQSIIKIKLLVLF